MSSNMLAQAAGCGTGSYICCCTTPGLIATIVIGALGLTGHLSLWQVSTGCLVASLFSPNLPGFIVGIMGLCGAATLPIVSGVALGGAVLSFMIFSVCSSGAGAGAFFAAAANERAISSFIDACGEAVEAD